MDAARRPRSFWKRLTAESDRDGVLPVAARHGVKARTLSWWRWRLSHEEKRSLVAAPKILPVQVIPAAAVRREVVPVEVAIDGVHVRVAVGTEVEYVARLVAGIRAQCSR